MRAADVNDILSEIATTILILPKIKIYMEAGYNFHNARERVLYLKERKRRIKRQNLRQE